MNLGTLFGINTLKYKMYRYTWMDISCHAFFFSDVSMENIFARNDETSKT